jgi:IclR family transcriptional regulator, pca regulon regulatory protein
MTALNEGQSSTVKSALFVSTIEKGLRLLEAVGQARDPLSLSELADASGLHKSATQRLAYTLHELGYMSKDPVTRRYGLGTRAFELVSFHQRSADLIARSLPVLSAFRRARGEAIDLSDLQGINICEIVSLPYHLSANTGGNRTKPAFCNSAGRAILSLLPIEQAKDIILSSDMTSFTPYTLVGWPPIKKKLEEASENGFSISMEEYKLGEIAISSPISIEENSFFAAVTITCASRNRNEACIKKEFGDSVRDLAHRLSQILGAPSPSV